MKILVVNNHSKHIDEFFHRFKDLKVIDFEDLKDKNYNNYDSIILSGGSSYSVIDHEKKYVRELDLIKKVENLS